MSNGGPRRVDNQRRQRRRERQRGRGREAREQTLVDTGPDNADFGLGLGKRKFPYGELRFNGGGREIK